MMPAIKETTVERHVSKAAGTVRNVCVTAAHSELFTYTLLRDGIFLSKGTTQGQTLTRTLPVLPQPC